MSLIVITSPMDGDPEWCANCLQIQLRFFRNKIKEQWNRYNNDGKDTERKVIPLELDPHYLMERAVTCVNGTFVCLTHMFNGINAAIENEELQRKMIEKPKIVVAEGSIDGFRKGKG